MSAIARIRLTGKHAVGTHTHAIVDAAMLTELSKYRWKAKPNAAGNHVYAVRNTLSPSGRWMTIRMHRAVTGYAGPLDIDHINRNALDNRRANLRVATRRENAMNRGTWSVAVFCPSCGKGRVKVGKVTDSRSSRCARCRKAPPPRVMCSTCGRTFDGHRKGGLFCTESCKKKAKRRRQLAASALPPSQRGPISPGKFGGVA